MPVYFQKPENALKRAKEFIDVGKKESALEILNDIIRSKKHRQWSKTHEQIMFLFTKLCVELQRSAFAKDGLYQYRNLCKEASSLNSFKNVLEHFLSLAQKKAAEARAESEQTALQDIEDLDYLQTPESLLLCTVSGEGTKERTDRVMLTPWVKFLWESYRNMLDLLKNNTTIKSIYADVAKKAFNFCLDYQRRTEFRKLCEILRNHLSQAQRYQNQQYSLKFDDAETVQCLVEIRLQQLESSISVDLWQEAFKAIEEIHHLMNICGKAPRPGLLDNFYLKQAKVYLMAKNKLFHAAALHKIFVLRKEQKKTLTSEDLQNNASQVLLATLSVPIEHVPSESDRFLEVDDNSREKSKRLASLLRMPVPPSRATLIKDLTRHSIIQHATAETQLLYHYLEVEFNPLLLCKRVLPILERLQDQEPMDVYVEPLKKILLVRLIKQVSQVYQTIKLSRLVELVPFITPVALEKVVVKTAHSSGIQVRIDQQTQSLRFGMDLRFTHKEESPEGPFVQPMPSEVLCKQLVVVSQALQDAVHIIRESELKDEASVTYRKSIQECRDHSKHDHKVALQRKNLIETRKEYIESKIKENTKRLEDQRRERENQEKRAEMERLKKEAEEREKDRKKREIEEIKLKMTREKLNSMKQTQIGARAIADLTEEELVKMDPDDILAKQIQQMDKQKKEKEAKLRSQERRIDYFERAKRLEEIPLLKEQYKKQIIEDKEFHGEMEENKIAAAIKERKEAESANSRLHLMTKDKEDFLVVLEKSREEQHLEKMREFEERLDALRKERLETRKRQRKEKRKAEAVACAQAEKDREIREKVEAEKKKKEEEEREKEMWFEAQRLKQEQREREVEERRRKREEEKMKQLEVEKEEKRAVREPEEQEEEPVPPVREDERKETEDREKDVSWRKEKEEPERPFKGDARKEMDSWRTPRDEDAREQGRERMGGYQSEHSGFGVRDWSRGEKDDWSRDRDRDRDWGRDQGRDQDREKDWGRGERDRGREWGRGERDRDWGRGDRDRDWGRGDRDKDWGRGDRDRDWGRGDRDREWGRGERDRGERDRDRGDWGRGGREWGRDGDRGGFGDRDRGGFGDRDRGRYGDRDRDRGGYGDRDRDRGVYGDRDRDRGGYGDRDRDRGGYGDRDRDHGRYGDRDRDRGGYGSPRTYGRDQERESSSWRQKESRSEKRPDTEGQEDGGWEVVQKRR